MKKNLLESRCRKLIIEGEMQNAEAALAAKDIVDRLLDIITDLGKMSNDELPALIDSIRGSFGQESAEAYQQTANQVLNDLLMTVKEKRAELEKATLVLTGDASDTGSDLALPSGEDEEIPSDKDSLDGEDFGSDEAAPLGREARVREAKIIALKNALNEINKKKFPKQARRLAEEMNRLAIEGIKEDRKNFKPTKRK
jgi:hypothetical protein